MLSMPSGMILKLQLIVILFSLNLAGTHQHSYGTVSVDNSKNIGVRSSVEQLAKEIQENVFFKALLEKRLTKATGLLVKSLNFTDGDKRQSLANFLVSLLPGTHDIKDDFQHTYPATTDLGHAEVRFGKPVQDTPRGLEVVNPKESPLEMFGDKPEGPDEATMSVPGGTVYKSGNSNALLGTGLDDEDDDLDSIIAQTLADDTDDDDSDDIHLILGDPNEEAPKHFNAEKLEDMSLISNVIREIISDESEAGDSGDIHVLTQDGSGIDGSDDIHMLAQGERGMGGSDDIHVFSQDVIEGATLNGKKADNLDGINLEVLDDIGKTPMDENNVDDSDDSTAPLNFFKAISPTINSPTINMTAWNTINAAILNAMSMANDIYKDASNGFHQHDVNIPTTRDSNVQISNNPISHKQSLNVFAHDAEPSKILLKLPEKLVALLQSNKLSDIAQYLLEEVNTYKSLVKHEGAENLVYPQGNSPLLSNEKLLQLGLLVQRPEISLTLTEQMEPTTKSIESFPNYYHGQFYESDDNLPHTDHNTEFHIDSKYLDEINRGFYLTNYWKEPIHWPKLVKDEVQSSIFPHLWENSQLIESIPSIPRTNSVVRSPLTEKSRLIQSWLESIPVKKREFILYKTATLLHEYIDQVKGGLFQVLHNQFPQPDKGYNQMPSQNYDIIPAVTTNSTNINAGDNEIKSIDQIVFNLLKIDDLPGMKQNAMKAGFKNSNNLKANNDQQIDEQFIATTNSKTLGSQKNLNVKDNEFDANNAPRRSKRSKEWPQSDAGSVNHKFRNKKLFLTQQFQIMRHEKSQETRQMAGVDSKMNQILPWGISVKSEVRDLYEGDRHEPPLLSRDHELDETVSVISGDNDKTASVMSGDNEANSDRDGVNDTAIMNRSNSGLVIHSTSINEDNYRTSTTNLSIPIADINLNNAFTNESKLGRTEAKEMEDMLSNVINKRNFVDYLQNETRNNETVVSLINNTITLLNSSVEKLKASNITEKGNTTNVIRRRELGGWNNTNGNISQITEQDIELHASLALTNSSSKHNNNESEVIGGNDQDSRVKRDIKSVRSISRGGSNVEQVPSWILHYTTKPTSIVRPDKRREPTQTIRPEQTTLPSTLTGPQQWPMTSRSDKQNKTNFAKHDKYGSGYANSKAKADISPQFHHTISPIPNSLVGNNEIENAVETQTRPPDDTQGSTEAYITRYLREKENAEKLGRKRDTSSNSPTINKNQGSNRDYYKNANEQRRKVVSSPEPYYESKSNYPDQEGQSGSTYADRFLKSKNQRQSTARPYNTKQADNSQNDRDGNNQKKSYKFTSKGDTGSNDQLDSYKMAAQNDWNGNDRTDSYKVTAQNDRNGNDQTDSYKLVDQNDRAGNDQMDSYKLTSSNNWDDSGVQGPQSEQQVSSTDVDGVQIQDLALEGGGPLHMVPPEPMVVHYQPVITYYTPPIHYSQIPEYMDFTSKLFTPTDPGQWDTGIQDTNQDVQSMTYPNQDQQVSTVNEPKLDQETSIKHDQGADQGWVDDVQTDSIIYDSNDDQPSTVHKQHTNQQTYDDTNQWPSGNDQIKYENVQSNNWGEDRYYTNDYQNTQTGSGNYNQRHNFRTHGQRFNKNRKLSNPTNYGTNNFRNQNKGTFINYSTNQNYKNPNQARPYYTQKANQYSKQRTSTSTSTEDDMDDEAVLQFIFSQKKINTGQSGMSSSDSQDYYSSSTNYQLMDSTANKGGQTKEDKMIDDIVEHYISFKPNYGYGQSNNNKMGIL